MNTKNQLAAPLSMIMQINTTRATLGALLQLALMLMLATNAAGDFAVLKESGGNDLLALFDSDGVSLPGAAPYFDAGVPSTTSSAGGGSLTLPTTPRLANSFC
jgi:hypothetical protein